MIAGVDEVGRGPWAGPLVVGAVVLGDVVIEGLTDSKKLSAARRRILDEEIRSKAASYGLGWVHAEEIDAQGLSKSLELACRRAIEQLTVPYHEIIIDGTVNLLKDTRKGPYVTTMKKADLLIGSVSAAAIIAKVARDAWMAEQEIRYPGYGFGTHVGYGTAAHRAALETYGVTPLHRRSFAPIAELVGRTSQPADSALQAVTTKALGNAAEATVAAYLEREGHTIVSRNWSTARCEVDIVTRRDGVTYCVEVKHRTNAAQGGGIAAITPRKLSQMRFAATLYAQRHDNAGDMRLAVGPTFDRPPQLESSFVLE